MKTMKLCPKCAKPLAPDALQFAHDEGRMHRDIKPENTLAAIGWQGLLRPVYEGGQPADLWRMSLGWLGCGLGLTATIGTTLLGFMASVRRPPSAFSRMQRWTTSST